MSISDLTTSFASFRAAIERASSIVLTTHVNPDGDGLGSELALALALRGRGASVRIINHSPVPANYRFLDERGDLFETYSPLVHDMVIASADLIVVVDTNHPGRLMSMATAVTSSAAQRAVIDHHLDPDGFASVRVLDDRACATGEIIFHLLESMGAFPLSPVVATALYVAIMTDTGSFRFPKTDAAVHRVVARLLEFGADPVGSYQQVFEEGPANRLQLLGEVLSGLTLHHGGAVCTMAVTRDMFARTGTVEPDTDGFISSALTIGGVRIALLFTELADGVKISFRSKGEIPINNLAKLYGGNGHRNAAGARVTGQPLQILLQDVVTKAGSFVKGAQRT